IREALRVVQADALVYLLAGGESAIGAAGIVPRGGPAAGDWVPLVAGGTPSPGHPDVHPPGAPNPPDDPPDEGCRGAWGRAVGDLVRLAGRWRTAGPARLVLVPLGLLGVVPWHAAWIARPGGRRYAVEDLVVSYSPSAQALCDVARRPAQPVRSALVVGDPGGDLSVAGGQAQAIHQRVDPGRRDFC